MIFFIFLNYMMIQHGFTSAKNIVSIGYLCLSAKADPDR